MAPGKKVDSPFPLPENVDPDVLLLLGDPNQESMGRLCRYMLPAGGGMVGALTRLLNNAVTRRPLRSSLHITALYILGGVAFGEWGHHKKAAWSSERDLQYLHYVSLHPEDFLAPERVRYRNYLRSWHPFR